MKNLLILVIALAMFSVANAQTDPFTTESYDQTLDYGTNRSYVYYTGVAGDTVGTGDSTWTYSVRVKTLDGLQPNLFIDIDSTGGTQGTYYIDLESKSFPSTRDTWTRRERSTWSTGLSTTVVLRSDSVHRDALWRVNINGVSDSLSAEIQEIIIQFWED